MEAGEPLAEDAVSPQLPKTDNETKIKRRKKKRRKVDLDSSVNDFQEEKKEVAKMICSSVPDEESGQRRKSERIRRQVKQQPFCQEEEPLSPVKKVKRRKKEAEQKPTSEDVQLLNTMEDSDEIKVEKVIAPIFAIKSRKSCGAQ